MSSAIDRINEMLRLKHSPLALPDGSSDSFDYPAEGRRKTMCTIFLGFTSNMISSGLRESIRFLCEHNLVDCIVTSAGGVEEDLIKCLKPTYIGDFALPGKELRMKGHNRIGNLLVPNENYCAFEDWIMPIFDQCVKEAKQKPDEHWTPSKLIRRLGLEVGSCRLSVTNLAQINDKSSVCYWAAVNRIPIFCPAITDGSLGDMLYMHSFRGDMLRLDIVEVE